MEVVTEFKYNADTKCIQELKMVVAKDHATKEEFTTKNIIVQKDYIHMKLGGNNGYYWNLHTTGTGDRILYY